MENINTPFENYKIKNRVPFNTLFFSLILNLKNFFLILVFHGYDRSVNISLVEPDGN